MAVVALAMVGSALGGAMLPATMLGGLVTGAAAGQALGAAVGGMIDQALFAPRAPDTEGPRLETTTYSNVAKGAAIPRLYGVTRPNCPLIWATQFREHAKTESVGGKGLGGGADHTTYTYSCSFAVAVGERASRSVKVFFDGQRAGDLDRTSGEPTKATTAARPPVTFYDGAQTEPDPLILSVEGEAPSYRGVAYLVFEDVLLTDYGNRLPIVSAEVERDLAARTLAALLEAIAADYAIPVDLTAVPEREIWGLKVDRRISGRSALESVMGLHQLVGAFDDEGRFRITPMQGQPDIALGEGDLVEAEGGASPLTIHRARPDDASGEIRLSFPDVGRDHQPEEVIASRRIRRAEGEKTLSTAMPMTQAAAMSLAQEALEASEAGRETARGVLPPSLGRGLRPGNFLEVTSRSGRRHLIRLTSLSWDGTAPFEGAVAAQTPPRAGIEGGGPAMIDEIRPYGPVDLVFLDLPLLRGDEVAHAPHIAAWASPWAGAMVYRAAPGGGAYAQAAYLPARATMGVLEAALAAPAAPHVWAGGAELLVRLRPGGLLSSASEEAADAGVNAAALEWPGGWEILQWQTAELISPNLWRLTNLRRGMRGTEFLATGAAPAGARFIALTSALLQPDLPPTLRGRPQDWLWGPSNRARDDEAYQGAAASFAGVGLRPFAPASLSGALDGTDLRLTWARRSRGEPDTASGPSLPLNEEREEYRLEIRSGGVLRRTATLSAPAYAYSVADRLADGAASPLAVTVRQVSAVFGPGAPAQASITF